MKTFNDFVNESLMESISYEEYCGVLDSVADNTINEDLYYLSGKLASLYHKAKEDFEQIRRMTGMAISSIVLAFKQPTIFGVWRAFKYSFAAIFSAVFEFAELIRHGLFDVIEDISNTGGFKKLEQGALKVDELIQQYPILAKLTGVVLAGMMLYMWLNMTFIGNFKYDMNLQQIGKALAGSYTFGQFITTKEGKSMLVLFGTGSLVSFPWLGITLLNLIIALLYTGMVMLGEKDLAQQVRNRIKSGRRIK